MRRVFLSWQTVFYCLCLPVTLIGLSQGRHDYHTNGHWGNGVRMMRNDREKVEAYDLSIEMTICVWGKERENQLVLKLAKLSTISFWLALFPNYQLKLKGEIKNMEECFMRNLKKRTRVKVSKQKNWLSSRPRSYGRFKITGH